MTDCRAAYSVDIGKTWDRDLFSYAAVRDAARWQLDRPEPALWSLLDGIEFCYQDLQSVHHGPQATLSSLS